MAAAAVAASLARLRREGGVRIDVPFTPGRRTDELTADGAFVARVATRGALNAPWGMAIVPGGWGRIAGDLLAGNFGDGRATLAALDARLVARGRGGISYDVQATGSANPPGRWFRGSSERCSSRGSRLTPQSAPD